MHKTAFQWFALNGLDSIALESMLVSFNSLIVKLETPLVQS